MTLIEPAEVYACRTRSRATPANATASEGGNPIPPVELKEPCRFANGWDEHIIAYVSSHAEPVRIVSIASQLRKCVRHGNKQHKEKLKRDILLRIGSLIRSGTLVRIRRTHVVAQPLRTGLDQE